MWEHYDPFDCQNSMCISSISVSEVLAQIVYLSLFSALRIQYQFRKKYFSCKSFLKALVTLLACASKAVPVFAFFPTPVSYHSSAASKPYAHLCLPFRSQIQNNLCHHCAKHSKIYQPRNRSPSPLPFAAIRFVKPLLYLILADDSGAGVLKNHFPLETTRALKG